MEFIPLESPREKKNKRIEKNSKEIDSLKIGKENVWTLKGKTEKKYLKNKYREKMIEKRERKLMVRTNIKANKRQKSFNEYTNDEGYTDIKEGEEMGNGYSKGKFEKNDYKKTQDEEEEDDDDYDDYDDDDDDDEDEEENRIENEEDDEEKKERAKRRKWKKQDEKKKNRLFFKMKKRIMSDSQVKEFHPDIKQVIFPRKKKTKWCWAVFSSEEKANQAFSQLAKNKEIFVSKPILAAKEEIKREKKLATLRKKKDVKKKFLKMWM